MRGQGRDHTLQATALVNEAYLRLVDVQQMNWQNRAHFFAMAARLMRRVLVDSARAKGYQKRGGGAVKVTLTSGVASSEKGQDLVRLDEALEALAKIDDRKSRVVELRYFGGLSVRETAEVLGVSQETVTRDWRMARSWLMREMTS
jgi:RNA polymerase sigma factor (TIGR02999 family)